MTVAAMNGYANFNGSGSTGPFTFNFRFFDNSQIVVMKTTVAGTVTLVQNTDYTVAGAGSQAGGTVYLTVPLNMGESIMVRRIMPLAQPTRYSNFSEFFSETHELSFDYLTMLIQQLSDQVQLGVSSNLIGQVITPADIITNSPWVDIRCYADALHPNGNLMTAVADVQANPSKGCIQLWRGQYTVESTIHITVQDLKIVGVYGENSAAGSSGSQNGTEISFSGTGALFQLGSDNGDPWDAADYNGTAGFQLENVVLDYTGTTRTALANGGGPSGVQYGTGTYGIQDWRGGDIRLTNVAFKTFQYGFWGVQSDVNYFKNVNFRYCKVGIYAGPRSDQFSIDQIYGIYCDQVVVVDQATVWIKNPNIVGCGYQGLYPIEVKQNTQYFTNREVTISDTWFEKYQGTTSYINAFIGIGVNPGYQGVNIGNYDPNVSIKDVMFLSNNQGNLNGYAVSVVDIGIGNVKIDNVVGDVVSKIAQCVNFVGGYTSNVQAYIKLYKSIWTLSPNNVYTITGGGSPGINYDLSTSVGRYVGGNIFASGNVQGTQLTVDGSAGTVRDVAHTTAGVARWIERVTSDPETGADAGSNYQIVSRHDDGSLSSIPFSINRATGMVTIPLLTTPSITGPVSISGGITGAVKGTTTNDNASAGYIGETISQAVASSSGVSLTTNVGNNVTSITLTPGDWDVEGSVSFQATSATVTFLGACINTASQSMVSDGTDVYSGVQSTALSFYDTITPTRKRISVASNTTVYLIGKSTFSAGSVKIFGALSARRVR